LVIINISLLRLFALGEELGLWRVVTSKTMGFDGEYANQLADEGFVMISPIA